ncbi:crotonase/enoyl-CoA hydratase family protein [Erythrobacter sp. HL-111]|uniref:crotonase/enoyl-CoA hydratase family protein n=1 Tax=Erythrobacter sp. HL-111 TaxID=1798193 RepID=UPI0006D9D9E3|nr:crotonase/enoyl-CoA hydratase family protein [Erythrobacter sp. HL-111]KPP92912.1 MAG: enoyl-CoA hydratase [Erythrobacteraceae bacterium HL-111]SDT01453.1 enoyl-CoA hydratase [Erythrobacter sp. HL-111]
MTNTVQVENEGPVRIVTIDRPERRNAVDRKTAAALADAFRDFERDAGAAVAVLAGAGDTFCAGADLKSFAEGAGNRVSSEGDGPMGPTRLVLAKPVIAAVAGHAVAGGLELACWCDLRVVEEDAVFGVFCRRWGVPLIDGGTVRLPRIVGRGRALDMILTGRAVDAAEAKAIGLADRVVAKGRARAEAIALAREIARFPQATMRSDRESLYRGETLDVAEAMAIEFELGMANLAAGRAGAARFSAGRGRGGDFGDI